jgi:predicted  nucleic acid-binding Zn-ribbon protein
MSDRIGKTKSELAQAEAVLRDAESQLKEINAMLEERWNERRALVSRIKVAASNGEADKLLEFQARTVKLDQAIADLGRSGARCMRRLESARRYLDTLNERLTVLEDEAEQLAARIRRRTQSLTAPLKLNRVNLRIEAIKGNEPTGIKR